MPWKMQNNQRSFVPRVLSHEYPVNIPRSFASNTSPGHLARTSPQTQEQCPYHEVHGFRVSIWTVMMRPIAFPSAWSS